MFTKSLDKILANFRKVQSDLSEFVNHHHREAEVKAEAVANLNVEIANHYSDANKAQRIRDNINNLLQTEGTEAHVQS